MYLKYKQVNISNSFYLWKIWIPGFPNHLPQMHMYTNDVDYLDHVQSTDSSMKATDWTGFEHY